jgi:hypothetical protein
MNRQSMSIRATFFGVSTEPDHATIAALVETARLSFGHKVLGCKTLQFGHVGQFTPRYILTDRPRLSRRAPHGLVSLSVRLSQFWCKSCETGSVRNGE